MNITITEKFEEQEFLQVVRMQGLRKFNLEKTNGKLFLPDREFAFVARNEQSEIIGGIFGSTYLSCIEVEVLWVHEAYRKQGIASGLMHKIEEAAKDVGCVLSHLTTYSFQAPHFYEARGYHICGTVDGFPDDIKLYTLKKKLSS